MTPSLQTLLLTLFTLFILMIFIISKWFSSDPKTHKNLPPSPPKLPIIGNLHQLGLAPHQSLQALAQRHGQLMLIHLGSVPVLLASSAYAAQEIMKTHDLIFANRVTISIAEKLSYGAKNVSLAPYGEHWRQVKSIYVLNLLSSRRVRSFRQVREDETALMIDTIGDSCGSVVNLSKLLSTLTGNVVCRVALGRKYSETKLKDLMKELMELFTAAFSVGNYIPWLSWVDRLSGLEGRADKFAKELDEFLESMVIEHLERKNGVSIGREGDEDVEGQDVADILLDIQREQATGSSPIQRDTIKVLILEMFSAGTDTTHTSLEWAMSEVIRHPRVMKKLQQEVRQIAQGKSRITEEDLEKTPYPYLKAVLKETMRLHTPLPLLLPREAMQDVKLMGYDIAAGTQVLINAWAIGRDPLLWEEPEVFRPERFLNSSIDYKGLNFELLPFGAGRRGCPGIQFAIAISELALANLVYKFDFALPADGSVEELDMSETTGLTLHKKSPLLLVATPCC